MRTLSGLLAVLLCAAPAWSASTIVGAPVVSPLDAAAPFSPGSLVQVSVTVQNLSANAEEGRLHLVLAPAAFSPCWTGLPNAITANVLHYASDGGGTGSVGSPLLGSNDNNFASGGFRALSGSGPQQQTHVFTLKLPASLTPGASYAFHLATNDYYLVVGSSMDDSHACYPFSIGAPAPSASVQGRVEGTLNNGELELLWIDWGLINKVSHRVNVLLPACFNIVATSPAPNPVLNAPSISGQSIGWELPDADASNNYAASGAVWVLVQLSGCSGSVSWTPSNDSWGQGDVTGNTVVQSVGAGALSVSKLQLNAVNQPVSSLNHGDTVKYVLNYTANGSGLKCFDSFDALSAGNTYSGAAVPANWVRSAGSTQGWKVLAETGGGNSLQYQGLSYYQDLLFDCAAAKVNGEDICSMTQVIADVRIDGNASNGDSGLILRDNGLTGASWSGYRVILSIDPAPASSNLVIQRNVGASPTWPYGVNLGVNAPVRGAWYTIKAMELSPGVLYVKHWTRGTPEPTGWEIIWTDPTPLTCGSSGDGTVWRPGIPGANDLMSYDNVRIGNLGSLSGVRVWDTVPAGIDFSSASPAANGATPSGSGLNEGLLRWDFTGSNYGAVSGLLYGGSGSFTWTGVVDCAEAASATNTASAIATGYAVAASNSTELSFNCAVPSATFSATPTQVPAGTATYSPTPGSSATYTATRTGTGTQTHTATRTVTPTPTPSGTPSRTPSATPYAGTPTDSPTAGPATETATPSATPTQFVITMTHTAGPSSTQTPYAGTPTNSSTRTNTVTLTNSLTPTTTGTPSRTPSATPYAGTPTVSPTAGPATATSTETATPTQIVITMTHTAGSSATVTPYAGTPSNTATVTNTRTVTPTGTLSRSATATTTATPTYTPCAGCSPTVSWTDTVTPTASPTGPTGTQTPSATRTVTFPVTASFTASVTPTGTPSRTPVSGLPDLIVQSAQITMYPYSGCDSGQPLGLLVTVRNQGAAAAGPFQVGMDGSYQSVTGLAVSSTWQVFFGSYSLTPTLSVDAFAAITESDESNNTSSPVLPVPTPPAPCPPTATFSATPTPCACTMTATRTATPSFTPTPSQTAGTSCAGAELGNNSIAGTAFDPYGKIVFIRFYLPANTQNWLYDHNPWVYLENVAATPSTAAWYFDNGSGTGPAGLMTTAFDTYLNYGWNQMLFSVWPTAIGPGYLWLGLQVGASAQMRYDAGGAPALQLVQAFGSFPSSASSANSLGNRNYSAFIARCGLQTPVVSPTITPSPCGLCGGGTITPTNSPTPCACTFTQTPTPSITVTACSGCTNTSTVTVTSTATRTATGTLSRTATNTATPSNTPTICGACTATDTVTPSATRTPSPSITNSPTPCAACTATVSPTPVPTCFSLTGILDYVDPSGFSGAYAGSWGLAPNYPADRDGMTGMGDSNTVILADGQNIEASTYLFAGNVPLVNAAVGVFWRPLSAGAVLKVNYRVGAGFAVAYPSPQALATGTVGAYRWDSVSSGATILPNSVSVGNNTTIVLVASGGSVEIDEVRLNADLGACVSPTLPPTRTATPTPCGACTVTATRTLTPSLTASRTATPSSTPTPCGACTPTVTPTDCGACTYTSTVTPSSSRTASVTITHSPTPCGACTATATRTLTPSLTASRTATPSATLTPGAPPACVAIVTPLCVIPLNYAPVCGCNGVTYSNMQDAWCHSITSFTNGACSTPTPPPPPPNAGTYPYPNPAQSSLNIAINAPGSGRATLQILNSAGMPVTLVTLNVSSGLNSAPVDLSSFANGIYLYAVKLELDDGSTITLPPQNFVVVR